MTTHQVYAIKFADNPDATRVECFHGSQGRPHDERIPMTYYVWLIRGTDQDGEPQDVVVDAGFTPQTAQERGRPAYHRAPADALRLLGVEVETVPWVVVSHFHYDHTGDLPAFGSARYVVQEAEMAFWTGRNAHRREFLRQVEVDDVHHLVGAALVGRVRFVAGSEEVVPGVRVHHVPGHTPGSQVVQVRTEEGTVVLASDAAHLYANIERDAPFGVFTDLAGVYDSFTTMRRLASSPGLIVPGHDPLVLEKFPAAPDLDGIACRIA